MPGRVLSALICLCAVSLAGPVRAEVDSFPAALSSAIDDAEDGPVPDTARLESLEFIRSGDARRWTFNLREGSEVFVVRVTGSGDARVLSRREDRRADPAYWAALPAATTLEGLDALIADAEARVAADGATPQGAMVARYRQPGPAAPDTARQPNLEVYFEIAGDEMARRVIYRDGAFDRITPARMLRIELPSAEAPAVQPPENTPPTVTPPEVELPVVELPETEPPEIDIPDVAAPDIEVRENDEVALIRLPGDVLFDFDKADIRSDAARTLEQVAALLSGRYDERPLTVHGHTDAKGSDAYNMDLSDRRADAVRNWLVAAGIDPARISTVGHGETRPVAPNTRPDGSDDPEGRQLNRRVEIAVRIGG